MLTINLRATVTVTFFLAAYLITTPALAHKLPPATALPLANILTQAVALNLGQPVEVEYDDRRWQIILCTSNACQKVELDPNSGQELRRKTSDDLERLPPAGSESLLNLVTRLESQLDVATSGRITSVELDDGYWQVQILIQP